MNYIIKSILVLLRILPVSLKSTTNKKFDYFQSVTAQEEFEVQTILAIIRLPMKHVLDNRSVVNNVVFEIARFAISFDKSISYEALAKTA